MTEPDWSRNARLEINAKHHKHDARYERVLELFETDRAAYDRLPGQLKAEAGIYADFRSSYRDAVKAGVIPDDRGPSAA